MRDSMLAMTGEQWLREFHDVNPGITSRAFFRGGSYQRLAARIASLVPHGPVLDLACGDGTLLALLGPNAVGVDSSAAELQAAMHTISRMQDIDAAGRTISRMQDIERGANMHLARARAQALPFRDETFEAAACHLAFMLFDDVERVVAELARVLEPGAPFIAVLGGGPTGDGDDAFHAFAKLVDTTHRFGDKRASSEAGWRELFVDWQGARDITFERWPLDLSGTFDEVSSFLSSSYQLRDHARVREQLRAAFPGEHVPCSVATYCATVTR